MIEMVTDSNECKHKWEMIDQIPCWYHVGEGCFEQMYYCEKCDSDKYGHSHKELDFDKVNKRLEKYAKI